MTRDEFALLIKGMKAVYFSENFLKDQYSAEMWYTLLKDLPYKAASASLKQHMQTSSRIPTPADIRSGAVQLTAPNRMSEMEAWSLVSRAISRSGYYSQEEYDKLSPEIQKAVGSSRQLFIWSQTDTDSVETVVQSQFLRSYRTEVARSEKRLTVSPDIAALIDGTVKLLEDRKRE